MKSEKISLSPSKYTIRQLQKQALEYTILENSQQLSKQDIKNKFYILSVKWFNKWKQLAQYGQILNRQLSESSFQEIELEIINCDIIDNNVVKCFEYFPTESHPWNTYMKEGLIIDQDFLVVDEEIWKFFTTYYSAYPIIRLANNTEKNSIAAVNLLRFKCCLIQQNIILQISEDKIQSLKREEYLQVDKNMKLVDYYLLLQQTATTVSDQFSKSKNVRLWRYIKDQQDLFQCLFNDIKQQLCKYQNNDGKKICIKCEFLDPQQFETIDDIEITNDHLIIVELLDDNNSWCLHNNDEIENTLNQLQYQPSKSIESQQNSLLACEKFQSDDETIQSLSLSSESLNGIVGLNNFSNSSFLNCTIQALANTQTLAEFFLKNQYFQRINYKNPYGTKGQLVKALGSLIKQYWYGKKKVLNPQNFSRVTEKFLVHCYENNLEFSNFFENLLNKLHQDLNEKEGCSQNQALNREQSDFQIASQTWENFKSQNSSIIIEIFYGQLKSQIACSKCQTSSNIFDPFSIFKLLIPIHSRNFIQFRYYKSIFSYTQKKFKLDEYNNITLNQFYKILVKKQKIKSSSILTYILRNHQSQIYEYVSNNQTIQSLRQLSKDGYICLREMKEDEIQTQNIIHIQFVIEQIHKNEKINLNLNGYFIFDINMTHQRMHHRIFSYLQQLFPNSKDMNYEQQILNQYYSLYYKSNLNQKIICPFCNNSHCEYCEIKYDTKSIDQDIRELQKEDAQNKVQIIIQWKFSPYNKIELTNIINTINQIENQSQNKNQKEQLNDYNKTENLSLQQCLQFSYQEELSQFCTNCHKQSALQFKKIYKVPQVLIFTLCRFQSQKNNIFIQFPIYGLNMADYIINSKTSHSNNIEIQSNNDEKLYIYDLYAVTNHFGDRYSSHYNIFVKNKISRLWYEFDDTRILQIAEQNVVTNNAYVLFYQIRENTQQN